MLARYKQIFRKETLNFIVARCSSTKSYKIVSTNDDTTFVSWHPMEEFPYECTTALPIIKEETDTVLKMQLTPAIKSLFNKKTPEQARQELMSITATTKHIWFPRARDKYAKKTPMDREYL